MNEHQMRIVLGAIQKAAIEDNTKLARNIASAGLTMLNGSQPEMAAAWEQIACLMGSKEPAGETLVGHGEKEQCERILRRSELATRRLRHAKNKKEKELAARWSAAWLLKAGVRPFPASQAEMKKL